MHINYENHYFLMFSVWQIVDNTLNTTQQRQAFPRLKRLPHSLSSLRQASRWAGVHLGNTGLSFGCQLRARGEVCVDEQTRGLPSDLTVSSWRWSETLFLFCFAQYPFSPSCLIVKLQILSWTHSHLKSSLYFPAFLVLSGHVNKPQHRRTVLKFQKALFSGRGHKCVGPFLLSADWNVSTMAGLKQPPSSVSYKSHMGTSESWMFVGLSP